MEFPFNINNLFQDDISIVDRNLTPFRSTYETARQRKDELRRIIDEMGKASAKAQNLHGPITSASKLAQSAHHLYIRKDSQANRGNGAVVGFLKVGPKKLFVYDSGGVQREMEPLCVLDFYVCESCQRQGCGRMLFDAMLQIENIDPGALAIDRPSAKCLSFLDRHYSLRSSIPQVNNFVVFQEFFRKQSSRGRYFPQQQLRHSPPVNTGGQLDGQLGSARSNQGMPEGPGVVLPAIRPPSGRPQSMLLSSAISRPPSGRNYTQQPALGMAAHQAMYSRHQVASPLVTDDRNTEARTSANSNDRGASPPLLLRGGPPADYLNLKANYDYLGRRGHLRLGNNYPSSSDTLSLGDTDSNVRMLRQNRQDTTLNIFGVPKLPLKMVNNPMPYRRTALW